MRPLDLLLVHLPAGERNRVTPRNVMDKAVRFIVALAIIAVFINAADPGVRPGVWHHDSGVYIQQGYNVFGGWPPVYPIFLQLVGRNVVHYQIVLGVISWCLLGYLLAGFPGLILGGIFVISPWFARWHGNCLTESFSLSFAALAAAFSILLAGKPFWIIPWFVSLVLFAFTRFGNVLVLPFLLWPILFLKGWRRWLVIGGLVAVFVPASLLLYSKAAELGGARASPDAAGHLYSLSSHRSAFRHLIDTDSRPYHGPRPMSEDYREYLPELSRYSRWLGWLKLPRHSYLWLLLTSLAILEMIRRRRLNYRSVVIISLFLAGYLQCLFNVMYQDVAGGATEIWRYLVICDAFLAFSVIAFAGMMLPRRSEQAETATGGPRRSLASHKNFLRISCWLLAAAGLAGFTAVIYSPDRFSPTPHVYGSSSRYEQGEKIMRYLEEVNSQMIEGWTETVSSPHSAPRSTWDHKFRPTCWIFADEQSRALVWESSVCPRIQKTTLVFGGVLSGEKGEFLLSVNEQAAMVFSSNPESAFQEWEDRGFKLAFFAFRGEPGRAMFGTFCLTIPEDETVGGESWLLRVEGSRGSRRGYFMLEQSSDTLSRLGLSR